MPKPKVVYILSGGGPVAAGADGAELPRAARPRGLGAAVPGPLLQRHHTSVSWSPVGWGLVHRISAQSVHRLTRPSSFIHGAR